LTMMSWSGKRRDGKSEKRQKRQPSAYIVADSSRISLT